MEHLSQNILLFPLISEKLTNFYNQNPKATTKIIFQVLAILFLADIVWIFLFSSAWEHPDESDKKSKEDNVYWDSLWLIHKIVYILAYIELILKGFLLYYLFADFKEKYQLKDLFNFNMMMGKIIYKKIMLKSSK